MDRTQSPAYHALRPSVRRLLKFVEHEIERGGDSATLYHDQLQIVGSVRVYMSGCRELAALGF
jgi:hypothetical protein